MTVERRRISRDRILEGAAEILDAGVYGDLTVDALARTLHMSKSTLYKHFTSKEDVIVALVDEACSATEAELGSRATLRQGDPTRSLEALFDVCGEHANRLPRSAILQRRRLPAPCQDRIEVTQTRMARACQDVIARGQTAGVFEVSSAALAATAIMAASVAAMEASARGELEGSRGDAVRSLMALFLPGLVTSVRS
jgi:AcrR family transcriptional regulator